MTTLGIPAGSLRYLLSAVVAITGLLSQSRSVIADEPTAGSREKVIVALIAAREEYLNGVSIEDEKRVLSEVFLAEQSQRSSSQGLTSARALEAKGIITGLQLEAAVVAADSAKQRLDVAQAKLKTMRESKAQVLEQFERLERMLREVKAK
jgi:hypothetical protein